MPTRAKGKRYPVEVSGVSWLDLLGYGSMLRRVNFDPGSDQAIETVKRLEKFQITAAKHATRHISAMLINDGVLNAIELAVN